MRVPALLISTALGVSMLIAPSTASAAATSPKACTATVSNARPTQRSTVVVAVSKVAAGAVVTTTAHYKTTISTKTASANSRGAAALPYLISRATHGFLVVIGVTAAKGSARWVCSTSFTTR